MQQNVKTGLGVVLIIIILTTICVFFWKSQTRQNSEPSLVPTNLAPQQPAKPAATKNQASIETENYKVYKNEKYGFDFKYPENYFIKEIIEGVAVMKSSDQDAPPEMAIQINQDSELQNLSIDQIIEKKIENLAVVSPKKYTFAGKPAYEGVDAGMVAAYAIYVKNGNDLFELTFNTGNKDGLEANKAALDNNQKLMLESFKFIR